MVIYKPWNVPLDGGVAEQPEDDGQEDSTEGAETAGILSSPVYFTKCLFFNCVGFIPTISFF
ncbi:MAG TPA: hypothetical protein VGW09_08545 [Nitrososphaeraceae archaeon]|nr:hypothetical protein [Nitrososphaeraceae archaeon]